MIVFDDEIRTCGVFITKAMQLYKLKPFAAPKHYVFKDPDTGRDFAANTQAELTAAIVAYRQQNSLPSIEFLDVVLDHYWAMLPENIENRTPSSPLRRGFLAYVKGGVALISKLFYGVDHLVDQATADRRASICVQCRYNVFPDKGPFVAWSDQIAAHMTGDLKSKHNDLLGNCEVCSCLLRAKVFWRGNMGLTDAQEAKMRSVGCWQVEVPKPGTKVSTKGFYQFGSGK